MRDTEHAPAAAEQVDFHQADAGVRQLPLLAAVLALALAGLIPARVQGELRGTVRFGGEPLSGLPPHDAAQHVGLVFQNPNLQLINMTVQSEVAFGPENLALPQPEIATRVATGSRRTPVDSGP